MNSEQRSAALKTVDGFLKSRGVHLGAVSTLDLVELMGVALAAQPPQDERGQGLLNQILQIADLYRNSDMTEGNFTCRVIDAIQAAPLQPVALSTLTDELAISHILAAKEDSPAGKWLYDFAKAIERRAASAPAQQAPQPVAAEVAAKAQRYDWLKARLLCADFQYGEPSETCSVLVFEIPENMRVSANLNETIDAAMAGTGSDESAKEAE